MNKLFSIIKLKKKWNNCFCWIRENLITINRWCFLQFGHVIRVSWAVTTLRDDYISRHLHGCWCISEMPFPLINWSQACQDSATPSISSQCPLLTYMTLLTVAHHHWRPPPLAPKRADLPLYTYIDSRISNNSWEYHCLFQCMFTLQGKRVLVRSLIWKWRKVQK